MDKARIEQAAWNLQAEIWKDRHLLWPNKVPEPLEMLEPEIFAHVLGIMFDELEELGRFGYLGSRFETAGIMHRRKRIIAVSKKFSTQTMRFTAAHEIGHWLLHPGEEFHRDRPIKGLSDDTLVRAPMEAEADYFAGCLLMPPNLLRTQLEKSFGIAAPFVVDDAAAFWLSPQEPDALLRPNDGSRARALAIASAESFGVHIFQSLARQFRVSPLTMAIRLGELKLVREWP